MNFHSLADTYKLNNGVKIPIVGFGTWQTPDGAVAKSSVLAAINAGYRLIDTAAAYGNEESVGEGIKASGVNRHDLFVSTKLWNTNHGYDKTKKAIDTSLQKLGLDYLDLYLIHWPNPAAMRANWAELNAESWRAMEEAVKAGKIRAIGISNFRREHIDELLKTATIKPAVNQNYLNPSDMQKDLTAYNDKLGILNEAYSPLGTGGLLDNETVNKVAKNYGKSPAQVLIRWSLQHGFLPLPKSVHPEYIKANADIFDFEINSDDMKTLDGLHGAAKVAQDPDKTNF
ncbi:aldo/keto reductase [Lactobacillus acetotolerans]|jgi:diketogulonate reductase-like aldo/keto reductase|uniref:Aldo/keto reductase n=1 Tax=Lactobacillus acetotolerans TaxID=1600 RepID=A0A353UCB7_9LACO|nr:aldo/keto reductase [Lactobacillus acetotolerans]KRN37750.1 2,5-didehydrogluconate reductase [Lactobacillus acetotolerans DSM 20749 = JCM 3825]MBN7277143.1 aldo/keto reductase [Lactobacillus acetotolerans]QFG50555.1 aldo/keto reductase [Lactobacillus acetotolerans]QJD72801.1 aldo/keto reductase [Lactobacillus acetotolerans]GGV18211.1 oxidoreductase [Lactobacillus acetotolerans DSM 20749 = JCM 3825]